ncbi:hypothetical protein [Rhodococcus sp. 1168]|uniref:hypothetical protein n=1 Tax=Rhodococcus sp. 1168 TaxID=2018041 RepID=UPI0020CB3400|nr:hypothetical protein [Rhodococcus sp. 1168]
MTNPTLSLVAALLDRSGSMHSIADDTRGGFDSFISKEREAEGRTMCSIRGAAPRCTTRSAGLGARSVPGWP